MEQLIDTLATGLGNSVGWLAEHGVLFGIFAIIWIGFAGALVWSAGSLDQAWTAIRALPMYLGLDLRGGVHFLMQVDMKSALTKKAEALTGDIRALLRDKLVGWTNDLGDAAGKAGRDLRNRAQGVVAEAGSALGITGGAERSGGQEGAQRRSATAGGTAA